jgi:hypothetical protein
MPGDARVYRVFFPVRESAEADGGFVRSPGNFPALSLVPQAQNDFLRWFSG